MKRDKSFRLGTHPFLFLMGYKRVSVPKEQLEALLNLCRKKEISYFSVSTGEDSAELCVHFFSAKRLLALAAENGLSSAVISEGGLPALIIKHRTRLGIPVGIILFALLIFLSGTVVWDVRVDGERRLCEEEVEAILEQCGLSVGTPKGDLDIDVIENRALILSDDISWISVNMRGTVANVEIREIDFADDGEPEGAANLVADTGGMIVRLEGVRGNIAVDVGDAVSEGQLLVGGIYGDEENPFKYTSARGKVFAECFRDFSVTVPRKYQKKVYSEKTKCEKYLIFFKNEIKFFGNSGNSPTSCDKIETVEYLRAPGGHELPVGIRTVTYREYSYEEAERSDSELSELALYKLNAEISSALPDADILSISTEFELTGDGYTLTRRLKCVRNIAVRKEIDIK